MKKTLAQLGVLFSLVCFIFGFGMIMPVHAEDNQTLEAGQSYTLTSTIRTYDGTEKLS